MALVITPIRQRAVFLALKTHGQRLPSTAFAVQAMAQPQLPVDTLHIGYTASSHSIGNAVQRNRARRRLKAAVDTLLRLNPNAAAPADSVGGYHLALIARPAILTIPHPQLLADLTKILHKLGFHV